MSQRSDDAVRTGLDREMAWERLREAVGTSAEAEALETYNSTVIAHYLNTATTQSLEKIFVCSECGG